MDEKELEEFSLEDILNEFGSSQEEVEEKTPEDILRAVEAEVQQEQEEQVSEEPVSMEETMRFEPVGVTDATIRLEAIPDVKGTVNFAQRIDDEQEEVTPTVPEDTTEPYSEQWEPDYEDPIAEYIPPRPVLIHPRSRFRELKRKLVAGPERLYYAMSEQGVGKLQVAIFLSVLVVLISAMATALYALGYVQADRMRLMVFGQFLAMLVSALLGSNQLLEGAGDLLRKKFSINTLLIFTFVLCVIDGALCLKQLRVPCCAAFSLQVTMALWRTYQQRVTRMSQLDTMRKATHLDSLGVVENYADERKGILRGEGQVEDFMQTLDEAPRQEKVLSVYALVSLCISLATGILAGVLHTPAVGIQVAAVTSLAAMPASMFLIFSRPMAILQNRLSRLGAVLCGWQGIEGLNGKMFFPLTHNDLFPAGTVKLNGVKFFGSRQPDDVIASAAAVVCANGGALEPLFSGLLDSRNGIHYDAINYSLYEEGGIGGVVNGENVLVGSLSFLKDMGVDVPEGLRISQAICVSVEGELCGLFAVAYESERDSRAGLATLCGYHGLRPVIVSDDFILTEDFIRNQFDVNTKRMRFPETQQRQLMRQQELELGTQAKALVTGHGLAPFAYAVTGARSLKSAVTAGMVVHMAGGILGMIMMIVLAVLGATEYLTPAAMFLYELLWMIPGLLVTEWTRSI